MSKNFLVFKGLATVRVNNSRYFTSSESATTVLFSLGYLDKSAHDFIYHNEYFNHLRTHPQVSISNVQNDV